MKTNIEEIVAALGDVTHAHTGLDHTIYEMRLDPENGNLWDHADSSMDKAETAIRRLRQLLEQNRPPSV
jgi:hypothetical protein